ncbi:regulator of G-protein signaling 12 isoform X2 [Erinaceus europaeus]|uniref:Regulator of G-protein signaling 12 isoform X2 n=1 Tax=Erinaceus europaeus TaxID=9365 RepID=A0ABM3WUK4_ERIEU|nr:regulator of G-protein signaling 12 isoform X2 [Erinaceus europaeus]
MGRSLPQGDLPEAPGPAMFRARSVEVARGRGGYGFTLAGQAPCVLGGVVPGGPAEAAGLRAGDQVLAVNGTGVRKASHEDVVQLVGRCAGPLQLLVAAAPGSGDADEDSVAAGRPPEARPARPPSRPDARALGINRAERVVEDLRAGGILGLLLRAPAAPAPEPGAPADAAGLDAGILNVAMVVGYLGSVELPCGRARLEADSLLAVRGCLRRLRAGQRVHSLVSLQVLQDAVRLCSEQAAELARYPAEKLAFSAVCPDDRCCFGLVTVGSGGPAGAEDGPGPRTSCHAFAVEPALCPHRLHRGLARRFGLRCTADPDSGGCLEFPASALPVLQFVSVLYRDMGGLVDGLRARAFADGGGGGGEAAEGAPHTRHSSASDSGFGTFPAEERGGPRHGPEPEGPPPDPEPPRAPPPAPARRPGRRRPPGPGLQEWGAGPPSDQESFTDSTDGWSSANCGTLPPPMSKIPADRYRPAPPPPPTHRRDWARRALGAHGLLGAPRGARRTKDDKKAAKSTRGPGLAQTVQGPSTRRSFSRSRRLSITRSLDNLESAAASDGELSGELREGASTHSLSSNASLPGAQGCRPLRERRVASWAVSFERLLLDPLGVRYFSDFLRKEFSEENLLFWQACEHFSHVPRHDKKELSHRAREIFGSFLCSKATTPVNIDSQAQLADDVLTAPHPDMFREQQLQIFNLMKFDSYTRFLKSPLYQDCILAEVEGRPLPDSQQPQRAPGSPASRHSAGSDHSNTSTPKKLSGKSKSGRSLNEELGEDDGERRRKGAFFSWSRTRSTGRSQKKKEHGDQDPPHPNGGLGRRESQGSVSSAGSLDPAEAGRTPAPRHCSIQLPDGSSCRVPVRPGTPIRDLLAGLCERQGLSGAAVDLFLVGGDKPLVLHQDSSILESRDLRLEKRTLFRLDLVPINRSVGLKAKPTKPVTEVLRPVVAKYGLQLGELVARLSGERTPLDLGAPIASLDGQRVILEEREPSRGKVPTERQSSAPGRQTPAANCSSRTHSALAEDRPLGKSNSIKLRGARGKSAREPRLPKQEEAIAKMGGKKSQRINVDEAEEFFELISKAQSSRADDQRGLLRKEDLELPDFLRLPPAPLPAAASPPDPTSSPDSSASPPGASPPGPPSPGSPEREAQASPSPTGEGFACSPPSTPLPTPPSLQDGAPPRPGRARGGKGGFSITGDHAAGSAPGWGAHTAPWRWRPGKDPPPQPPARPGAGRHHATFV